MITRRKFAKISALAGIGMATGIPAPIVRSQAKAISANEKINVGLIGCKSRGWSVLQQFIKSPEVECIALCDVDETVLNKRSGELFGLTGKRPFMFSHYKKMLELKEIAIVIIGTPDHWHCLPFVDACKAGKDIYVEKPLANSIAECNIMLQAAKKYNRIVTVGQQQRSATTWASIMELIKSGTLGDVKRINGWANFGYGAGAPRVPDSPPPQGVDFDQWLGPAPLRPFNRNRFHGSWRMNWDYGGGLMTDWGVHLLDMALWAMGDTRQFPETVVASGGIMRFPGNEIQTPDTLNVVYNYGDCIVQWENNGGIQSGPWNRNYGVSFVGSKGTVVANRESWELVTEGKSDKPLTADLPPQPIQQDANQTHVRHFLDAVKNRKQPDCTIEIGHAAAVTALLGNLAYRTGEILKYDPQKQGFMDSSKANSMMTPIYRGPYIFPSID
ncbi:MAG: Gfo/Idh/MocA family oxidoreductase [Prolixibacteraceae bacterium]|jgi:predicted dehydrogenase|nr:Gfo/Idh/MocA family oxidoreductase [Prolixibacteraceae bacterium]